MEVSRQFGQLVTIFGVSALLSSCMLGPDFHKPAAPDVQQYTKTKMPSKTASTPSSGKAGKSQVYVSGEDIPANWWYLFHSPEINTLVQTGIANSPNLRAAEASLRQAQEILNAQIGNTMYPAFSVLGSGARQGFNSSSQGGGSPSTIFNLFNLSLNVSYTLDIFGANRREIESLRAQVDYSEYQLLAAYLTLTSNIVTTAVSVASLQEQIRVTRELITTEEDELVVIRKQYQLGGVPQSSVLTQETLVSQTRATLPVLQNALSQSQNVLSVLVGSYPNQPLPSMSLQALTLPVKLPVSLPSKLVQQRPDIGASEALVHAASAQIGVATANLFPQFTINGNFGWSSLNASSLIGPNNKAWLIGGTLTQPLFQGGALMANKRKAVDAYEQAMAMYRQTLLQSFQNVSDSLKALETDSRTFHSVRAAELSAYQNLKITKQQYHLGGVNYLNLLTAQAQYQETSLARIKAQAARYTDTVALYQSLGGGWWNVKTDKDGKAV